MKPQLLAITLALTTLGCSSALAATNSLGLDPTLNLLTFGNFSVPSSDVEGRVAVGGNASLSSYTINSPYRYPGAALTVAGNLSFTGGDIYGDTIVGGSFASTWGGVIHGNVSVGGTLDANAGISATSVTTWGPVTNYQPWYVTDTPGTGAFNLGFDFAAKKTQLTQLSTQLDLGANTGTASKPFSTVIFNASNSHGINIFDVSAADVGTNMQLTGLGAGGTVIINVHGSDVDFGNHGFTGFDSARGQVLFNLVDATSVHAGYVEGSILAPSATFSGGGGVVWGQVVVDSWSGSTQVNSASFIGSLPVAAVPEPETYAMLLAGLGLIGAAVKRRKAKQA